MTEKKINCARPIKLNEGVAPYAPAVSPETAAEYAEKYPGFMRRARVSELVGLQASALYARMRKGNFPLPIHLSRKTTVWRAADVMLWIKEQGEAA